MLAENHREKIELDISGPLRWDHEFTLSAYEIGEHEFLFLGFRELDGGNRLNLTLKPSPDSFFGQGLIFILLSVQSNLLLDLRFIHTLDAHVELPFFIEGIFHWHSDVPGLIELGLDSVVRILPWISWNSTDDLRSTFEHQGLSGLSALDSIISENYFTEDWLCLFGFEGD